MYEQGLNVVSPLIYLVDSCTRLIYLLGGKVLALDYTINRLRSMFPS